MKRIVSAFLVLILISINLLTGCGSSKTAKGPKEKKPFTFDYSLNESNAGFFTDGDTINTLMAANPFYTGSQPLPSQKTSEFETVRAAKVEEIKSEADKLVQAVDKAKPRVDAIRSSYLSYMNTCKNEEKKLSKFSSESVGQIITLMTKEQFLVSEYQSFNSSNISNPFVKSMQDYLKVTKGVELGSLYLQDANNILGYAAIAYSMLENHENPKIKEAGQKLDKEMEAQNDLKKDLTAIITSLGKIDNGFKQLETGDYYLALEATGFIESSLPDLKAKADAITPRDGLSAADIEFIKSYLAFYEKFNGSLKENLNSMDKSRLVQVAEAQKPGITSAYAAETGDNYSNAYKALATPLQSVDEKPSGYLASAWNGLKTVAHGAQTAIGVTIDTAGAAVANISQVGCGIYYGNKPSEIWADMKKNSQQIINNYNNSVSGASTLRQAGNYLEGTEDAAKEAVGGAVESQIGKGWTSWAVGGITKATVGMFTGLGKGIYKLANRDSSTIDIVTGTMDVGMSFVGGSKVIIKGSQIPGFTKGLTQEALLLGQRGLNFIKTSAILSDKELLKKETMELIKRGMTQEQILQVISNNAEIMAKDAALKVFQETNQALMQKMKDIFKEGGKVALENATQGAKESLEDLVKKSFEMNIKGIIEALGTTVGKSTKDYVDNLIGSWVDDYIKNTVAEVLRTVPEIKELAGSWTGAFTITEIPDFSQQGSASAPQTQQGSSSDQGCEGLGQGMGMAVAEILKSLEALKGKPLSTTYQVEVTGEDSGQITMLVSTPPELKASSKPNTMTFTYKDGKITGKDSSGMIYTGTATKDGNSYSISGQFEMAKMRIAGTWTAEK